MLDSQEFTPHPYLDSCSSPMLEPKFSEIDELKDDLGNCMLDPHEFIQDPNMDFCSSSMLESEFSDFDELKDDLGNSIFDFQKFKSEQYLSLNEHDVKLKSESNSSTCLHEEVIVDDMIDSHEVDDHNDFISLVSFYLKSDGSNACSVLNQDEFSKFVSSHSGSFHSFIDPFTHYVEHTPMKLIVPLHVPSSESSANLGDKLRRYLVGTLGSLRLVSMSSCSCFDWSREYDLLLRSLCIYSA